MSRYLKQLFFGFISSIFLAIPAAYAELIVDTGAPPSGSYIQPDATVPYAAKFTIPAGDWTGLSVLAYFRTQYGAINLRANLYANDPVNNMPSGSPIVTGVTSGTDTNYQDIWVELPLSPASSLPGGDYWVAYYPDAGSVGAIWTPISTPTATFTPLDWYAYYNWGTWNQVPGAAGMSWGISVSATKVIPEALPDLTGSWSEVTYSGPSKKGIYTVSGTFTVQNAGQAMANAFTVNYYSSSDGVTKDNLLKEVKYHSIAAGSSKATNIKFTSSSPDVFIADIDPANIIKEMNEANNVIASPL